MAKMAINTVELGFLINTLDHMRKLAAEAEERKEKERPLSYLAGLETGEQTAYELGAKWVEEHLVKMFGVETFQAIREEYKRTLLVTEEAVRNMAKAAEAGEL